MRVDERHAEPDAPVELTTSRGFGRGDELASAPLPALEPQHATEQEVFISASWLPIRQHCGSSNQRLLASEEQLSHEARGFEFATWANCRTCCEWQSQKR